MSPGFPRLDAVGWDDGQCGLVELGGPSGERLGAGWRDGERERDSQGSQCLFNDQSRMITARLRGNEAGCSGCEGMFCPAETPHCRVLLEMDECRLDH